MYSFNLFENAGISPNVGAVIYGIEHDFFSACVASEYEAWAIENHEIEGNLSLLVTSDDKNESLRQLRKAGYTDDGTGQDVLRYAILASLKSQGEKLLDDIETVYADFDYPADMEPLIYYMPCKDGSTNRKSIVAKFDAFLAGEKGRLGL